MQPFGCLNGIIVVETRLLFYLGGKNMFIIWGTKHTEKELGLSQKVYQCGHCGNASNYRIVRRRNWFTIFWIPIIPLGTKYFITCPICNYGYKLKKAEALEQLQQTV